MAALMFLSLSWPAKCLGHPADQEYKSLQARFFDKSVGNNQNEAELRAFIKKYSDDEGAKPAIGLAKHLLAIVYQRMQRQVDALKIYDQILAEYGDDAHLVEEAVKNLLFIRVTLLKGKSGEQRRQLEKDIKKYHKRFLAEKNLPTANNITDTLSGFYFMENSILESARAFDAIIEYILKELQAGIAGEKRVSLENFLKDVLKKRARCTIFFLRQYVNAKPLLTGDEAAHLKAVSDVLNAESSLKPDKLSPLWIPDNIKAEDKDVYLANTAFSEVLEELRYWQKLQDQVPTLIPPLIERILAAVQPYIAELQSDETPVTPVSAPDTPAEVPDKQYVGNKRVIYGALAGVVILMVAFVVVRARKKKV